MSLRDDLDRIQHPVPRFYVGTVIGSLLVVALILAERGLGLPAFLVLVFGGIGLFTRWRTIPPLLLLFVAGMLVARAFGHDLMSLIYRLLIPWSRIRGFAGRYQPEPLLDALLVLMMLVYLQGHYRLVGLMTQALPTEGHSGSDRRKPIRRTLPPGDTGEGLAGLGEQIVVLVLSIFLWVLISFTTPPPQTNLAVWRGLVLIWLLGSFLLFTSTLVRVAFFRAASPEVHEMFLQEVLWRETRGEQSRIQRWIQHNRLKAQKRKERS